MHQIIKNNQGNNKETGGELPIVNDSISELDRKEELPDVRPENKNQALKVTSTNILYLQRTIGNQAVQRLLFKKPVPTATSSPNSIVQREITIKNAAKNDVGFYDGDLLISSETAPGLYTILKQGRFKGKEEAIVSALNKLAATGSKEFTNWILAAEYGLGEANKNSTPTASSNATPSVTQSNSNSTQTPTITFATDSDSDSEEREEKHPVVDTEEKAYFVETTLYKGGKHGLKWKEAKSRAKLDGLPQGKFNSEDDLNYLIKCAKVLKEGVGFFELPGQHTCVVYTVAGTIVPAEIVFLKIYPNGKIHAYPLLRANKLDKKPIQKAVI